MSSKGTKTSNPRKGISGCYVDGEIQANEYAGGICGYMYGESYYQMGDYKYANTVITSCYNNATVYADNYAGGIAASTYSRGCTIEKCVNNGLVSSKTTSGGILAYLSGELCSTWSVHNNHYVNYYYY